MFVSLVVSEPVDVPNAGVDVCGADVDDAGAHVDIGGAGITMGMFEPPAVVPAPKELLMIKDGLWKSTYVLSA
jgi:hypothetical protein